MEEYRKNQELELEISALGSSGEGIGRTREGFTVFVKDALPGDRVRARLMKVKKQYAFGRLMEIISPSPDRVEAPCPVARACGGCQLQALSYEKQLAYKENKVRQDLIRISGIEHPPIEPIIGMASPWRYRNKAQFPVGRDREGRVVAGFYAGRTHSIIPQRDCLLGAEVNRRILDIVLGYMEQYGIAPYDEASGSGLVRHILIRCGFSTGEIMVCLVVNGDRLPEEGMLAERLREIPGMTAVLLNTNRERTNVILGHTVRTIWGKGYITDMIGGVSFQISPLSFYQVNPRQTEKLYGQALEYAGLTGQETVWDIYCGIGTISLFLARRARQVWGVEVVPQAIEDARRNAALNGIENVEFFVGKAEEVLPEQYEKSGLRADVVVVDPPRKGCDAAVLETILRVRPDRIVYISCDPATMARDVKVLGNGGYSVEKVRCVDMFGMTGHVESIVLLSKLHTKQNIEVELEMSELDLTAAESKATYAEIKQYVLDKYGLKVSSLNIAQIKAKCGIIERENYNTAKNENVKQPNCTEEKENAIKNAFKYFQMI